MGRVFNDGQCCEPTLIRDSRESFAQKADPLPKKALRELLTQKYRDILMDRKPVDGAHRTSVVLNETNPSKLYEFHPLSSDGVCDAGSSLCRSRKKKPLRRTLKLQSHSDVQSCARSQSGGRKRANSDLLAASDWVSCTFATTQGDCTEGIAPAPPELKSSMLMGEWVHAGDAAKDVSSGNIFGGFGQVDVTNLMEEVAGFPEFKVAVCPTTHENLAYYGARLLEPGVSFDFETPDFLAITVMDTGDKYVEEFIMKEESENGGGGMFLEYHEQPHLWMPMDEKAGGYLILGKRICSKIELSAFAISYGKAIWTGANVIHNDCLMTGAYKTVYGFTEDHSAVRLFEAASGNKVRLQCQ